MSDESPRPVDREKRTAAGFWIATFVAVVVVYVLSPVPVAWVVEATPYRDNQAIMGFFRIVYAPLAWAHQTLPAVRTFYDAYAELFGVHL